MIYIAHRGNVLGKKSDFENNPAYVQEALEKGYDVEVDVFYEHGAWLLGHDRAKYKVDDNFLLHKSLWCHAKTISTLERLISLKAHCFWHQNDDVVLTSKNYLWTFPNKDLTASSIAVMPEKSKYSKKQLLQCSGLCTDDIKRYEEILNG